MQLALGMIGKMSTDGVPETFCQMLASIFILSRAPQSLAAPMALRADVDECRKAGEIQYVLNGQRDINKFQALAAFLQRLCRHQQSAQAGAAQIRNLCEIELHASGGTLSGP